MKILVAAAEVVQFPATHPVVIATEMQQHTAHLEQANDSLRKQVYMLERLIDAHVSLLWPLEGVDLMHTQLSHTFPLPAVAHKLIRGNIAVMHGRNRRCSPHPCRVWAL